MNDRKQVIASFLEMLQMVVPDVYAVYEFTKKLALFDKWLKNKKGIVILLKEEDYSLENLLMIDLVYDKIQDKYGWEIGTTFASSFSRGYIRSSTNLWHINIQNPHCLLPEDMINLKKTGKLLYGEDYLSRIVFPHQEEEILRINVGFGRKEAEEIAGKYQKYQPLINVDCCFARHDFTISHSIEKLLEESFIQFKDHIQVEKHIHLYGRYWGSGKTQIMYSLIEKCKELKIPFIYRTEFWKDENGKYMDIKENPENNAKCVGEWVAEIAPSAHFVLFLDEIDIDIDIMKEKLQERFSDYDVQFLIVSAAKEISDFVDVNFDIYDIVKEYPFSDSQYKELVVKLIEDSGLDRIVFPDEVVDIIVRKTKLWNLSSTRKTPTAVVLTATLALLESLKITEEAQVPLVVLPETAKKWAILGTSPWYQKYGDLHDVHAEYLIFDGTRYVEVDEHYNHPLP
ncbi:MAG: hypothetical protein KAS63_09900 [Candidatus Heimdallarchaeota archaeon]|nr:hypothetical protein [Candidatus Heimdallarchaeota archaeon]MCK4955664.1 hypothetical protein [Candidatus Heimdallarchaeota archaeon]